MIFPFIMTPRGLSVQGPNRKKPFQPPLLNRTARDGLLTAHREANGWTELLAAEIWSLKCLTLFQPKRSPTGQSAPRSFRSSAFGLRAWALCEGTWDSRQSALWILLAAGCLAVLPAMA